MTEENRDREGGRAKEREKDRWVDGLAVANRGLQRPTKHDMMAVITLNDMSGMDGRPWKHGMEATSTETTKI